MTGGFFVSILRKTAPLSNAEAKDMKVSYPCYAFIPQLFLSLPPSPSLPLFIYLSHLFSSPHLRLFLLNDNQDRLAHAVDEKPLVEHESEVDDQIADDVAADPAIAQAQGHETVIIISDVVFRLVRF